MEDLARVAELLHRHGLRMTAERRGLLEMFAGAQRWFTPKELHEAAYAAGMKAGMATVYRLLEVLVEIGRAKPYAHGDRAVRYVFCGPEHHHHLICEDCGKVEDVERCRLESPAEGFLVQEHSVDFFGLCPACRLRPQPAGIRG